VTGYKVQSLPRARFSIVFNNVISGHKEDRFAVLFPGETSYVLNLANLNNAADNAAAERNPWPIFRAFFAEGFTHVLPGGWDHILFVLGLVLLCRQWRTLVWQVATFTVAHTLTLGLATFGWLRIPAETLEPPVVALSIAAIAIENLLHPEYSRWRLAIVFIFGLVHGLGFAEGLRDLGVAGPSLALELLSFNLGVEGGQLTVIALALAATAAIRSPRAYRSYIAVPASVLIALIGLAWTFERLLTPR
jgi:hypothetical protein